MQEKGHFRICFFIDFHCVLDVGCSSVVLKHGLWLSYLSLPGDIAFSWQVILQKQKMHLPVSLESLSLRVSSHSWSLQMKEYASDRDKAPGHMNFG